ncbi:MAG TPA: type II secretion system protein GspC [Gammaproteobacteria bacterium]|nr:type II secretion system protein GspC [Gammaproteobacteria bacterium]
MMPYQTPGSFRPQMNFAEHLWALSSRTPAQWLGMANRILPPAVTAILVLTIAYQLARITWVVLPGEDLTAPAPAVAAGGRSQPGARQTNFEALLDSHLFGEPPDPAAESAAAPPPDTQLDAPDTTLNLRLSGVVVRELNEESDAMIANGNQPDKRYTVGDTLEGAGNTTLHHVYADRVLLNRSGRLETLRLPDEDDAGASVRRAAAARPAASAPTLNTAPLRQVITQNATEITRVMRFAPHVDGGQIIGFRVTPGPEAEVFAGLGLEPGDVVTDINGIQLDDPSRGLQAFEALGESTMANVTILRDGNPQVIVIDTTQLEALSEARQ